MRLIDRIGCRIKLHDLHVFLTVVEAGSMGGAAQRLNTVQPAISRSIAELEAAFGVRLLDRHRHGTRPTEYGRALLDCGAAAFDDLRRGVRNIGFLADPDAGEVRIGSSTLLAASYVAAVFDRLSRRRPRIVSHLVVGYSETLYRELSERKVDFLIARRFAPLADERLAFDFLFNDSSVVVAGAGNPWARRRAVKLADLVDELWTLPPPDSMVGAHLADAFRTGGLERPRATMVTPSPEVRFSLLATGRFLTMLPVSALRFPARHAAFKVLPVELSVADVPIGIVTVRNRTLSPTAQLFVEHARAVARAWTSARSKAASR